MTLSLGICCCAEFIVLCRVKYYNDNIDSNAWNIGNHFLHCPWGNAQAVRMAKRVNDRESGERKVMEGSREIGMACV